MFFCQKSRAMKGFFQRLDTQVLELVRDQVIELVRDQDIVPFWAMMSRHVKREPRTLFLGAVWLLAFHYVDLFWQIKPNMNHGHGDPALALTDVLAFVGVGGLFVAIFAHLLTRSPLVPVKDPWLPQSIAYEDV